MTDIMKLADDYARAYMSFGESAARAALQSAIEALQGEVERLKDINRDALSNLNQLCDLKNAEIAALQAENEAWGMSETCANADWESAAPKALEPEPLIKFRHGCKWCGKAKCAAGCHGITKGTP